MQDRVDIAITGAGPAGLALAVACAEQGLRTLLLDPSVGQDWVPTYAAWLHELEAVGAGEFVDEMWSHARVYTPDARVLPLPYARVHKVALQRHLLAKGRRHGLRLVAARVVGATARTVRLAQGPPVQARVVVDATGARRALVGGRAPGAWQVAWGEHLETPGGAFPPEGMTLMDWRRVDDGPPSFLYAMPLSDGSLFVEETALATRVPDIDLLRRRLHARLDRMGLIRRQVRSTERVRIPLDLPRRASREILAYGVAGGFVHPATGYSLVRSLGAAPRVAQALAMALRAGAPAVPAAYRAAWPASARRTQALHRFGLRALLGFDAQHTAAFFDRFFDLPETRWRSVLDASASPAEVALAMHRHFFGLDAHLQWQVLRGALSSAPGHPPLLVGSGGPS
jgi:lycopene beta-cyclase